jgi:HEAT repeat protein
MVKALIGLAGVVLIGWLLYLSPVGREVVVRYAPTVGPRAVPVVRHALDDKHNNSLRMQARESLLKIGKDAVPPLVESLKDSDPVVRAESVRALVVLAAAQQDIGEGAPALMEALHDSNAEVRAEAANALRMIGPRGRESAPALIGMLEDTDPAVRRAAASALWRLRVDEPAAIYALIRALEDPVPDVRREAAEAMDQFGPAARKAEPALKRLLDDPDVSVRQEAREALKSVIGESPAGKHD